jgi:alkanesulfonate monooxygenase SsuD/methylene tetrahydromethanopterin reductase-like flavin-dependent oxidoreductase (luciferase family)
VLRALLEGEPCPEHALYYCVHSDIELTPAPCQGRGIPLLIGSWGSKVGLRRVARAADGWLAVTSFGEPVGRRVVGRQGSGRRRSTTEGQLCVGAAEHCAALLSRYAEAGCQRIYLWPLGDEQRQIELVASEVAPRIELR